jgi:mannose/cellobiose epimerase-like protein (N-acyl-D-glucosamine 2-epimerase family)
MEERSIDRRYPGFLCGTDEVKDSWFIGRGAWVYAFLYRNLTRDPRHLEVARQAVEFALRIEPKGEDPRWPRRFTRTGETLEPDEEIYGTMFIAEGMAEYGLATGDQEYVRRAEAIVRSCIALYDRPGYAVNTAAYLGPQAPPFPGARVQGVSMLTVRLATQMGLNDLSARACRDLNERFYNPVRGLNNELLNPDYSLPTGTFAEFFYTGHTVESMWMVLDEARRLRDAGLARIAEERFRHHAAVSWDTAEGGYLRGFFNGAQLPGKVLWEQEEVLIAALMLGDEEMFSRTWEWTRANLSWLSAYPNRIENYHHPRYLMLNLLMLDKMVS